MKDRIRYVDDQGPGIVRQKSGKNWLYVDAKGRPLKSRSEIERLNAIALPPAYTNAWFCPHADGHIQAVGWDAKGRKQYRYHADFTSARDADKYARCLEFGQALSKIRKAVERDLVKRTIDRQTVIAAVVRLLDRGQVRIGNESYARSNKSYGATTLRTRHARVRGAHVMLNYVGKSGKVQTVQIEDRRLARVVRRCLDESDAQLFEHTDADGIRRAITSADVNQYLRDVSGAEFTAKHFRTWGASAIALDVVMSSDAPVTIKALLKPVAAALGNTPAIARKSYVHPAVIRLVDAPKQVKKIMETVPRATPYVSSTERALIKMLQSKWANADRFHSRRNA
jgi:DNA topoisomerase I